MGIEITADAASVGMSSAQLDRIGPALRRYTDSREVRGISTLVARKGEVVHTAQLGDRDAEAGLPITADTIFRIYSMTKPVVATALMLLHEEGAFQLEQPVTQYLPAFGSTRVLNADGTLDEPARPMQIRDLLMHTSGLTYDFMIDTPVAELYREARVMNDVSRTLEECIDVIASLPLAFQPGARWHYSVGIDVAARLIEVLSGQTIADFLQHRVFDPLGMTDTAFTVAHDQLDRLSAMYGLPDLFGLDHTAAKLTQATTAGFNERLDVSETYPTDSPTFRRGGIGLYSTIGDYYRFAQMLGNGGSLDGERVIGRKTLELIHTNHLPAAMIPWEIMGSYSPGLGFGLGSRVMVDVAASAGPGSIGEFGWAGAAKTYFWVDPREELVGVFMSQYMTGSESVDRVFRSLVCSALVD